MSEPRKASEILLALEEKIDILTKVIGVYDINIKLILDRVNKIYSYIEAGQEDTSSNVSTAPEIKEKEIVPISSEHVITEVEKQVGQRRIVREDAHQSAPIQPVEKVASLAPTSNTDRKVPIIQRVTLVDEAGGAKDLFMAEVSIFNDKKEPILKTKTNAAGKWQAHLKPGSYSVNIIKTDTATKKKIEASQEIVVNDSNTIITLPTAIIKR